MFELRPYRNNNHMTTYDPFRDMEALERAFFGNRDFLGDVGTFKTDIQDKGDHYLLEADLPGMKKEDIAIDIDGDNLTIKAERRNEHEEKDKSYVRCERSYGSYARSFDISGVKAEGIKASYNDGVLSLTLPKKDGEVSGGRRLAIERDLPPEGRRGICRLTAAPHLPPDGGTTKGAILYRREWPL